MTAAQQQGKSKKGCSRGGCASLFLLLFVLTVSLGINPLYSTSMMVEPWESRIKREANEAASLYKSALASGVRFTTGTSDVAGLVNALQAGVSVEDAASPFHGKRFQLRGIKPDDLPFVVKCLYLQDGVLVFQLAPEVSREATWRHFKQNWRDFGQFLSRLLPFGN